MELYLVRHGEPMSETENPERPLSRRGREEVGRVSAAAARIGLRPGEIRHSGKRRAAETAEILAAALGRGGRTVALGGMGPNDDVWPIAEALRAAAAPTMLVGHLPFLSRLASLLVIGDPDRPFVRFCMGGIVCLVREETTSTVGAPGGWSVGWMLTPQIASAAFSSRGSPSDLAPPR